MKNLKKHVLTVFIFSLIMGLSVFSGNLYSSSDVIDYGYISYVEGTPKVIRLNKDEHKATINLPVGPGDMVVTGEKDRCEMQFDNGTIIRIDSNSFLKVETVLAKIITSKKTKLTTLRLLQGKIYVMNSSYSRELFQILTANAGIKLKKHSVSIIQVLDSGSTKIFSERGKLELLYGKNEKNKQKYSIKANTGFEVLSNHKLLSAAGKDMDFLIWNKKINSDYNKLHYGKSKVPKKITRYGKAIAHWAEKWSSLYGEWIYDDIFGYMWKPADENFALSHYRPFFLANYIRINGDLFLVPQEKWGRIPGQLGTWVFLEKTGWSWRPGQAASTNYIWQTLFGFHSYTGSQLRVYSCFNDIIDNVYGSYDLLKTYSFYGREVWQKEYFKTFGKKIKMPKTKLLSKNLKGIFKKINKNNVRTISKVKKFSKSMIKSKLISPVKSKRASKFNVSSKTLVGFRDFNPDSKVFKTTKTKLFYTNKTNDISCPKLKISSSKINDFQRSKVLRYKRNSNRSRSNSYGSSTGTSNRSSQSRSSSSGSSSGGGKSKG